MPGAGLSSVQKCPARIREVSVQPAATSHDVLAASCVQAGRLLSPVGSCVYVQHDLGGTDPRESNIGPTCPCCEI